MNFFEGRAVDVAGDTVSVELAGLGTVPVPVADRAGLSAGDRVKVGIRPEHMRIARTGPYGVSAKIRLVEYLGKETIVYVDADPLACISSETGTDNITVHLSEVRQLAADDVVELQVDPADVYLFGGPDDRTLSRAK